MSGSWMAWRNAFWLPFLCSGVQFRVPIKLHHCRTTGFQPALDECYSQTKMVWENLKYNLYGT